MAKKEVKKEVRPDVKAQILKAAEQEFLSVGYAGARTTNIAHNAGVTHAMLHYYFQSKDNLFEIVFKQKAGVFFGSFAAIMETEAPFLEKIKSFVHAHRQVLLHNPALPMFVLSEATKNPALLQEIIFQRGAADNSFLKFLQLFEKETQQAIEENLIRPIAPVDLLFSIVSLSVFSVLVQPVLQTVGVFPPKKMQQLMKHRSEQIVEFVINAITVGSTSSSKQ
jgi:AcrR family transcriptional regulator